MTHSLLKALRGVSAFSSLDDDVLLHVVGASNNLSWPAGSAVFEAGDESEALYIVLDGEIRIVEPGSEPDREVARIRPGESFGEISLLMQSMHSKTAIADRDTELMVVPRSSFRELLEMNPDLASFFRRQLEQRLPVGGDLSNAS
jgi:CRP-like cAMP-binding protein